MLFLSRRVVSRLIKITSQALICIIFQRKKAIAFACNNHGRPVAKLQKTSGLVILVGLGYTSQDKIFHRWPCRAA